MIMNEGTWMRSGMSTVVSTIKSVTEKNGGGNVSDEK